MGIFLLHNKQTNNSTMRKSLLLVAGATMLALSSCEKIKDLVKFKVGVKSQDVNFSVPAIPSAGEQEFGSGNIHVNVDSIIKTQNNKAGVDNIKSAEVTEVSVEILNPDEENNLGVVERIIVELSSDTRPEPVTIAAKSGNPDEYITSMSLPLAENVDLADYLKANNYTYKLKAKTRRGTTKELNCKATIKYDLVVGLD
jgi:hypothetical protein